ncbi:hypothetical protein [Pseudooceanicola sp. 200-1SW]|uniref:hypothetical protein n=1 Tax=Pseudooceanicola sp. 200-1SW TaxID=3425949 RepID=UPI003D7F6E5A
MIAVKSWVFAISPSSSGLSGAYPWPRRFNLRENMNAAPQKIKIFSAAQQKWPEAYGNVRRAKALRIGARRGAG